MDEKRIAELMKSLDCSREEAIQVIMDDDDVDHGIEKDWDLSPEEHKKAMKMANTGTKNAKSDKKVSKAKPNPTKEGIIATIFPYIVENIADNAQITNKTREISFHYGEKDYTFTLIEKRAKK